MVDDFSDRIELVSLDDVAPEIRRLAAKAALEKLDAAGVTPLEACRSYGALECMDDEGDLYGNDEEFEPPYEKYGIVQKHLDANNEALDAIRDVLETHAPDRAMHGYGFTAARSAWDELARRDGRTA